MQAYIGDIVPMSTAGFQKNTSTAISFVGCDFNCPYCNKKSILDFNEEFLIDLREIKKQIETISTDTIIFTGGEPTLQKLALTELCRFSKKLNFKVHLQTNGSKPAVIDSLIRKKLVDKIILDYKCPLDEKFFEKVTRSKTFFVSSSEIIKSFRLSLKVIQKSNIDCELRTTIVPNLLFRKEDLLDMAREISLFDFPWVLQRFMPEGDLVDLRYKDIETPKLDFLFNLKESCIQRYPNLRILVDPSS